MNLLKALLIFIWLLFLYFSSVAQDSLLNISDHSDCDKMMSIQIRKTIGPTTSPQGYGQISEFENNDKRNLHFTEKENNSVWYKFSSKSNGNLSFEIEPLDSLNDYDFVLYRYTGEDFCESVKNKSISPVRTNFSRNKMEINGKTGLSVNAEKEFVSAGINPAYSKSIKVKNNEEFVLYINNVYDNGEGHILHFDYFVNLSLNGSVVDVEGEHALEANITITNTKTGNVVAETTSDSVSGDYKLVFDIPKSQLNDPLHLEVSKEGYFFKDTIITAFDIATKMRKVKINTRIKKLKKGDRFVVSNILFHGNIAKPLNRSLPSIKALYKTLKRNKSLKISIEGHTNGCSHGTEFSKQLSNARAKTVYDFLVERKVKETRLSSKGFGCLHLIHPVNGTFAYLNRRVEIEIVDL
ncbi:OmpA family protein [Aureispira]|nr:OmpA family protein [Aureispira sp.]